MTHRVEVLRPGSTPEFEFWSNEAGSIYLCRENGGTEWQAIVDGDVVIDQGHIQERFTHAVKPLSAPAPSGLVPLLAMQERLHVILDHVEVAPRILAD